MFPNSFYGVKVFIVRPQKQYVTVWHKTRRKYGRKWQKTFRFVGLLDLLRDGEVIETPAGFSMNEKTAALLQREINKDLERKFS